MKESGNLPMSTLAALSASIDALAARVSAIEERLDLTATPWTAPPESLPLEPAASSVESPASPGIQLPAVGISFLMLAGAFLLRAVTEAGMLPGPVGVALGLAYVLVLFFLADREARGDRRAKGNLFGVAATLVAYPILWETTKLGLLSAVGSVVVTSLVTTLALGVALRHRLTILAWIVLVAAVVVCTGLYWTTGAAVLFLAVLVALGVATVWLGYLRDWHGPRWLVAGVVNFLVFLTVMLAAHPAERALGRPEPDPGGALLLALALPVVFLGSFAWRTLIQRREAGPFEILQSLGCIMAGYVGAIHLLRIDGRSTAVLGWATLIAAVVGYVVAFILVRSRQGRGLNFFFYAWLGLLLTFIGTALVVAGAWLPFLWAGLGLAAAITGGIFDRWTLRLHCAAYLIGAAVVTGLPARFFEAFVARATPAWDSFTVPGIIVGILTIACYLLLVAAQRGREVSGWRRVPRFLVAAIALISAGNLVVTALAVWLTGVVPGPEGAIVAVVRTAVLSTVVVLLAALGRRPLLVELSWFVNPLLVLVGLKMVAEDLRQGAPISLFFGFACFGIALIVAPRLGRRPGPSREGSYEADTS